MEWYVPLRSPINPVRGRGAPRSTPFWLEGRQTVFSFEKGDTIKHFGPKRGS